MASATTVAFNFARAFTRSLALTKAHDENLLYDMQAVLLSALLLDEDERTRLITHLYDQVEDGDPEQADADNNHGQRDA